MSLDDFVNRLVASLWFLSNVIIMSAALKVYLETSRRVLMLVIISGAIGAFTNLWPWLLHAAGSTVSEASQFYFIAILDLVDVVLWTTGFSLLMFDYRSRLRIDGLTGRSTE